jgi:hypothetical protein
MALTLLRPMALDEPLVGPLPIDELATWALVRLQLSDWAELMFQPASTCRTHENAGQSLWSARASGNRIGIAFSWSVIGPGLLVVTDMASVQTNALLVDLTTVLSTDLHAVHLATTLHFLNWQTYVLGRYEQ